jgi:hypothetical protein
MLGYISKKFGDVYGGLCWKLHLSRIQWIARNALAFFPIKHIGAHMLSMEPIISCWPWFR